jgi:N-acetylhexosamine 1-kinase
VELSTRFLADYIDGDLYFKTCSPDHNLVRTRCQISLARDMLKKLPEMETIVRECIAAVRN